MNVSPGIAHTKHAGMIDDLEQYVEEASEADPRFKAALEDAEDLQRLMDCLLSLRLNRQISQSEVARRMGVRQPTVSEFEKTTSDPKLSTLQRYARAIDGRVRVMVEVPGHCNWSSPSVVAYSRGNTALPAKTMRVRHDRGLVPAWKAVQPNRLTSTAIA